MIDTQSRNHVVLLHGKTKTHIERGRRLDRAHEDFGGSLKKKSERYHRGTLPRLSEAFKNQEINPHGAGPPGAANTGRTLTSTSWLEDAMAGFQFSTLPDHLQAFCTSINR